MGIEKNSYSEARKSKVEKAKAAALDEKADARRRKMADAAKDPETKRLPGEPGSRARAAYEKTGEVRDHKAEQRARRIADAAKAKEG